MIEVRNLHKSFGDKQVLNGIDFQIQAGEFVVVLGPSGAGKSTLLRCLNRLTDPTQGEILINGQDYGKVRGRALQQLRRQVAMIFQHHNLSKRLSVLKNVLMGRMADLPLWSCAMQLFPTQDVELAKQCLFQVDLEDKVVERADSLSGGQQQRVGIARALAQQPGMMLADEPVASLDPKSSRKVLNCLKNSCKEQNIAVLCNLHQIDYAMEFAERIIGLSGGKVVFNDTPENLTPEMVAQIYPGLNDDNISRLVLRMAAERRSQKATVDTTSRLPEEMIMTRSMQFVANPPKGGWWILFPVVLMVGWALQWSVEGTRLSLSGLYAGIPWIQDFLMRMMPPNLGYISESLVQPAIQTLQIALWGTVLSIVLAIPVCLFAAKNLSPSPLIYHGLRQILNVLRGINEVILALIFVAAVGLGPFAGVLALAVHGAGMVGKFFAEAVEEIDHGPVEAMQASGCSTLKTILFAVLPQVMPAWIGVVLYRMEANIRISTVLGMVGAGGIGFELMTSMKMFEYENTAACVLVILVMVFLTDVISARLRQMIR